MMRRLAAAALALYPLAFRRRYAEEMKALLEEAPVRALTVLDLLRGALAAHLRPGDGPQGVVGVEDRLRASLSGVLACWIAFAAAGFAFYKTTEDAPFARAASAHLALGASHLVVQALAGAVSLAILAGGLPVALAAMKQARHRRSLRAPIGVALGAVGLVCVLTGALVLLAHTPHGVHPTAPGRAGFAVWGLAVLAAGVAFALAARRALFATSVSRARLLIALATATLASAAMAVIALATTAYAVGLGLDAADLAGTPNGPIGNPSTEATLAAQVAAMAITCALAVVTSHRGWRAVSNTASGSSPATGDSTRA
ncbi:MAG TPA: hypothetical protein VND98_10160 [Solirubrobacterales bacterium]|nr:hypothetical protein [Solirubrobacterales bacterium]